MSDLPESPGQVLAAARKRQNLSLADVTRQLRLSERQLLALERDAYDELPGRPFVRGFIRNYARLLRIDAEPLLSAIEQQPVAVAAPPPVALNASQPHYGRYAISALLLVSGIAIYFAWQNWREHGPEIAATSPTQTEVAKPGMPPQPAPGLPIAQQSVPAITVQDDIKLAFKRESFVEIRDSSGKPLLNRSNAPGSTQTIIGKPPYSVVIGNAEHVELTYQGESIDLAPHSRGGVARLILN